MNSSFTAKKIIFSLLGFSLSLIFILFIGELITRVHYSSIPRLLPNPPYDYRELDEKHGWLTKSNYYYKGTMADLAGTVYDIEIRTNEFGFRSFGDINVKTGKKCFLLETLIPML